MQVFRQLTIPRVFLAKPTGLFFHHLLFRKVLYFEWILLILCGFGQLLAWRLAPPDPMAPSLLVSLVLLCVVAVLSFVVPVENVYWDRMFFLLLEIVLITGAAAAGLARLVFPLFMVVIAKACLILDRAGLFVIGMVAFMAQIAYASYKILINQPHLLAHWWRLETILTALGGAFIMTYASMALMLLVAMLTLALVAEQKTRLQSEKLSKEVETLATELERMRIAREIHDALGHTLTSLNIQLDVARKFAQVDPTRSSEALELAKQLASQSLTDVRLAVQSIRSSDVNLTSAVDALVQGVQQAGNLEIDARLEISELPHAVAYQLYRVIQECLTNILKHAKASKASLELVQSAGKVELNVSDNGCGLDEKVAVHGFGIKGIRERVESMQGTVVITTEPHEGTKVQVVIPI